MPNINYLIIFPLLFCSVDCLSSQPKGCATWSKSKILEKSSSFRDFIKQETANQPISPELVTAIIVSESCFKGRAISRAGAAGLMQLMPATAKRFGVKDRFNRQQNIRGGIQYLSFLTKKFSHDLTKVIASYNAGEGAVQRYGGVPPYKETKQYLVNVMHVYKTLGKTTGYYTGKGFIRLKDKGQISQYQRVCK